MERVIGLILSSASWFTLLSLNAYNPWWLLAKGAGFTTSDRISVFGITSANFLGLFVFLVFYALALVLLWQKTNRKTLFKSGLWIAFAFFMLPTQMHERYIYPAFMFLALLIPEMVRLYKAKKRSSLAYFYIILIITLTLTGFYNLHNALIINYPDYGLSFLVPLNLNWLTMAVAVINTLLFLGLSFFLIKEIKPRWSFLVLGLAALVLVGKQGSFLLSKEVPLTKLKTIFQHQDYAIPMENLTVYSGWGPKRWAFLSNNYYFYRQGLGTHAYSRLVYDVNTQFKKFSTDIGIDTEAGENASVIFQVLGDQKLLYTSPIMGKFDFPQHIEIDITGVENLELVVNDSGDGITSDHGDWLNPILYK